jgi:hypothetical protein
MKQMMTKEAWKSDFIMATWNVRTMFIPGKMQEISKEIRCSRLESNEDKVVDREDERQRARESGC